MNKEWSAAWGPKYFIYGLFDPAEPDKIRYVGQTAWGKYRINQHFHARNRAKKWPVYCWMKHVSFQGRTVSWRVLELVGLDELNTAEVRWIAKLKHDGHKLMNLTEGGSGIRGQVPWNKGKSDCYTPEVRAAMSHAKRGKKWTDDQKKSYRQAIHTGKADGRNKMGVALSRKVRCLPDNLEFPSIRDAARTLGYSYNSIRMSIKGRSKGKKVDLHGRRFELVEPDKKPATGFFLGYVKPSASGQFRSC